ncbi:HmuY family protein [Viscerimonas tarda]
MNTKRTFQSITLALLGLGCFPSCDNKDDLFQKTEPKEGLAIVDCTSYTQWNFFSFSKGEIIGTCDAGNDADNEVWRNRSDWDLAFHRQDVKTNSGVSGTGKAGILEYNFDSQPFDFERVTLAPEDGYLVDVQDSIIYDMSQMMQGKIGYVHTGLTQVTKRWAVLEDMQNSKWVYAQKVFIVRTADGKYAKIYLKNFKSDAGASGVVTMQYVYQPDGTRDLDITKINN